MNFQVFVSGEEAEAVTKGIALSEPSPAVIHGDIRGGEKGVDLTPTERTRTKGKKQQI